MDRAEVFQSVYDLVRKVPEGRVVTYGQIAAALGNPRLSRVVGWAMRVCPADLPWHRVVNAKGQLSTHAVHRDFNPQRELLEAEGVAFDGEGRIDLSVYEWNGL